MDERVIFHQGHKYELHLTGECARNARCNVCRELITGKHYFGFTYMHEVCMAAAQLGDWGQGGGMIRDKV